MVPNAWLTRKWCFFGLSFANKGRLLHIVGHNGVAYGVNTETGELLKEFKITKKSITSLAFSHGEC